MGKERAAYPVVADRAIYGDIEKLANSHHQHRGGNSTGVMKKPFQYDRFDRCRRTGPYPSHHSYRLDDLQWDDKRLEDVNWVGVQIGLGH